MSEESALGMGAPIVRRDFIGGIAVATGAGLLSSVASAAPSAGAVATGAASADYPPVRSGLRGQYPGSFEVAHLARDGGMSGAVPAEESGEHYDLVIVGGGISGLSAAYFYRKALGDASKILILDNHDDFGGHAKRNEFHHEGRTILAYGGTMSIETPFPYSYVAKGLLADLGIEPRTYSKYDVSTAVYSGLGSGVFFDKEHFGRDKLVTGSGKRPWPEFFADAPLSPQVRADLVRLYTAKTDYMPDLDPMQKAEALKGISYRDFLLKYAKVSPETLAYFNGTSFRNNKRVDTCPAYEAARSSRTPGFAGMEIAGQIAAEAEHFHFPDGNASVARLLVNRLVPRALPGVRNQESIVLAPVDYARLDDPANPTRIRLGSMVIRVEHIGKVTPNVEKAVRIVYAKPDGTGRKVAVTAAGVVMACFNNILPYIVPELPEAQKATLKYASKVPMQYTNVLVRNSRPWRALGVRQISAPNGYHPSAGLDFAMDIGGYRSATTADEPVIVHMVRNPNSPGLPRKQQNKVGRADMLATPFEKSEFEIRSQLQRMLGPGGFDAKRDILAITVNRWPHGYAYTYDTLDDPDVPDAERPHVIGRAPFGRIAIANSDSAGQAFTNAAIDMAERAVQDLLVARGLT